MALRALILSRKIEEAKKTLESERAKDADFEKREAELEAALEELEADGTSEEDVKAVEEEVETFEKEKEEHKKEVGRLETAIEEAEAALEEEQRKNPVKPQKRTHEKQKERLKEERLEMRRGFFAGMAPETRDSFMQMAETQDFIENVRELAKQKRSVSGAELTIPDNVMGLLRDNMHRYSKLISVVSLKSLKGTGRQQIAGTVPEGIWMEAVDSLKELNLSFNEIEVDGYKVGGYMAVPNSTLEDSSLNLASEILDALGQAIGLAVDKAVLYGNRTKMPVGIVTRLAQTAKPSYWENNAPEWKDLSTSNLLKFAGSTLEGAKFFKALIKNLGVAKANYSNGKTFWCMNSSTKKEILAEAVVFNAAGAIVAGVNEEMPVIGGKIIELDFIPDGDIIGGYGSLYMLVERKGGQFSYSDIPKFIEDLTVFKGTARYDGKPVFGEAFVAVNIKNTDVTKTITFNTGADDSSSSGSGTTETTGS